VQEHVFLSADSVPDETNAFLYPTEFLNTLLPSGLPPHKLVLKIGAPIMLLRNMNGSKGQVNGTRMIVRGFGRHVIDAEIMTGTNIGKRVFIPRIPLIASDSGLPFPLRRLQYPIRPAFGMSINKAQGKTLEKIGLYLPSPVFSHGQLYVALSRVGRRDGIHIMLGQGAYPGRPDVYTRNIVYKEILR
jgi:ATP-dependent DNA helicase PIF1